MSTSPESSATIQDAELDEGREANPPIDKSVTFSAAILVGAVFLWAVLGGDSFSSFVSSALEFIVTDFGWLFVLATTVFVFFVIWIALSRFGHIKLGKDNEVPEFSTITWVAMMFAAGMGIGLLFYGTSEPLSHYRNGVPGSDPHNVGRAFSNTLFHWTLHPWVIYGIVGLAIAYSTFRMGRKQLLSAAFTPLIGEKLANGWLGKTIDSLAIFATIFGTAASLGVGVMQIAGGLDASGIIHDPQPIVLVVIVSILTVCFLISAVSGVGKGIRYLSNGNMILALFVLVLGPTIAILNSVPTALGSYLDQFFAMAARTANSSDGTAGGWLSQWTIFYWAWWISWSPFVGMFLARISRGRTVREFLLMVMIVPSLVSVLWFSIFGGAAINFEQNGKSIWGDGDATKQLFTLLHEIPLGTFAGFVAIVLLGLFFITSADSASTVMGTMSQNGAVDADKRITAMWGLLTALIGVVLLITGGTDALSNLQNITIVAASPFLLVIIGLMFAVYRGLSDDPSFLDEQRRRKAAIAARRRKEHTKNSGQGHTPSSLVVTEVSPGEFLATGEFNAVDPDAVADDSQYTTDKSEK